MSVVRLVADDTLQVSVPLSPASKLDGGGLKASFRETMARTEQSEEKNILNISFN